MFWCVDVHPCGFQAWKIDILVSSNDEITRVLDKGKKLLEGLDGQKRDSILDIKSRLTTTKGYRTAYRSTDIYEAVLDGGVRDYAGWKAWWTKKQGATSQEHPIGRM